MSHYNFSVIKIIHVFSIYSFIKLVISHRTQYNEEAGVEEKRHHISLWKGSRQDTLLRNYLKFHFSPISFRDNTSLTQSEIS